MGGGSRRTGRAAVREGGGSQNIELEEKVSSCGFKSARST